MVTKNERGVLTIPCLLLTLAVTAAGFGIWGLLHHWQRQVDTQLQLDACVGKKALELKGILEQLSDSNQRMTWIRRSAAVATIVVPEALAAIRAELEAEMVLQEGLRTKWLAEGAISIIGGACPNLGGTALRYPDLEWDRAPPDAIGPQTFQWSDPKPRFDLKVLAARHVSAARVEGDENEKDKWRARWANFY